MQHDFASPEGMFGRASLTVIEALFGWTTESAQLIASLTGTSGSVAR